MKVLFAAPEVAPFAKTGGLADVAGSLPQALARLGHDVRIVMPRYRRVDPVAFRLKRVAALTIPLASWKERCEVLEGRLGRNVTVYFIDKDVYYDRPELYQSRRGDYPDNAERFIFFSRAVPELCRALGFAPDIVHCNDWQTGLVPLYLRTLYAGDEGLRGTRTVFTIHNLGYQGIFRQEDLRMTGLGWDVFTPDGIEYWGSVSLLKAGVVYADAVTTVSETYSREIQTPEYGLGFDGVLRSRSRDLFGIVNGIDTREWNPGTDRALPHRYTASRPAGKRLCTQSLRRQLGLRRSRGPLFGMVTRLTDQKGLDILVDALPAVLARDAQLVILGTGEERYHRVLTGVAERSADRFRVLLAYDEELARRIYAGSDIFLMPSRYEPCGLGQMHALRYGSVPLVRRTGGLADTVVDHDPATGEGTGFLFSEYTADALAACVRRADVAFADPPAWKRLVHAGMKTDFSWRRSAEEYEKVYRKILRKREESETRSRNTEGLRPTSLKAPDA